MGTLLKQVNALMEPNSEFMQKEDVLEKLAKKLKYLNANYVATSHFGGPVLKIIPLDIKNWMKLNGFGVTIVNTRQLVNVT